mmetsp:Transcript_2704/g.5797  ORF Transcript_2704/g.5797 Transcript_2704/m.5797 type:complete len:439 (-) Transcript_2704:160-1476(-)
MSLLLFLLLPISGCIQRTTALAFQGPSHASTTCRSNNIACILNLNARAVNDKFVHAAEEILGKGNVFATATEEANDDAVKTIVERGYDYIVPGGGDGTLCTVINSLMDARKALSVHHATKLPKFAYLPLGTGNGMAPLVGPRFKGRTKIMKMQKTLTRLKEIVEECEQNRDMVMPLLKCPMIEVTRPMSANSTLPNSELCFFAGSGFDSLMLNDFNIIKKWSKRRAKPIRRFLGSVAGYTVALLTRTLPSCLIWGKHNLLCRITIPKTSACVNATRATSTYWMDPRRGDTATKVRANNCESNPEIFPTAIDEDRQLLFEGTTGIIAAGTTPYYGGGLKLFPFSRVQPHGMHLRLGRISPFIGFLNIPWIFRGSYRHYNMKCLDFVGKDFDVELSEPYPFQHSGEADDDPIKRFCLRVADEELEFVDFLKPRVVLGYGD